AAIAVSAIAMPAIMAFFEAVPASKPKIHGVKNRNTPRIRFATSHDFALVQLSMGRLHSRVSAVQTVIRNGVPDRRIKLRKHSGAIARCILSAQPRRILQLSCGDASCGAVMA